MAYQSSRFQAGLTAHEKQQIGQAEQIAKCLVDEILGPIYGSKMHAGPFFVGWLYL
ncbi:MAG: hypothetical protein IH957_12940 [Chloroflexi bacterium]|nr:hypothetical protein [Chloroflexota bacterium]